MNHRFKNKIVYSVGAVVLLFAIIIVAGKFIFPKAISGSKTTTTTASSDTNSSATTSLTQKITELITTTTKSTTKKNTTTTKRNNTKTTAEKTTVEKTTKKIRYTLPWNKPTTTAAKPSTTLSGKEDYSCFDNCAFIGNSRVIALENYNLVKNVYAVIGLTVDTVFTKSVSGSDIPVIDELNGKKFDRVYLMFGDNECGWPNTDVFIKRYAKVIAAVRERVPDAEIYLQSILPISSEASAKNEYGCNNEVINKLNAKIKQLAKDENVHFVDPAQALKDSSGALPAEAASDGVHLGKKYCKVWLNYLVKNY